MKPMPKDGGKKGGRKASAKTKEPEKAEEASEEEASVEPDAVLSGLPDESEEDADNLAEEV